MSRTVKTIMVAVAVVIALWLGYSKVLNTLFLQPRQQSLDAIERARGTLANYRSNLDNHSRVLADVRKYADRTLGADLETVDHRLRTRLNRLAEQANLRQRASGTSGGTARSSPAKSRFSRTLRDEIDFIELEGWVSGTGTFGETLALVHAVQSEPWIKRIHHLSLDPRDNGERFNVMLRLTTLFMPTHPPKGDVIATAPVVNGECFAALASANPFRLPPAPPVAVAAPAPSGPPAFPYHTWSLTGIAQSATGLEVWLLNRETQETRRLTAGEKIEDVVFVRANGEIAEFRNGDQHFAVTVGNFLSDRMPVNQ